MLQYFGSSQFKLAQSDMAKIAKGAGIAACGAALTYLADTAIPDLKASPGTNLFLCFILSTLVNAARKYFTDTTATTLVKTVLVALLLHCCSPAIAQHVNDPTRASYRVSVPARQCAGSSTGISPYLAVTNVHVVGRRLGVSCKLRHQPTGREWTGEAVAVDPAADVALVFVASGDLDWVEIGGDPQRSQPCYLLGYGGDGVLKLGSGRFLHISGYRMGNGGAPVWNAAVESISGDSGGGLFDEAGKLVSVNWGGEDRTNVSASTPASYVTALHQRWETAMRQQTGQTGWGPGGCPQFGGGGSYGGGVMPPKQPIQMPPQWQQPQQPQQPLPPQWQQPQPQQPLQPIGSTPPLIPIPPISQPAPAKPDDVTKLLEQIAAALQKPKPDPAAPKEPDIDELAKRVAERLPPLYVDKYVDGKKSGETVKVRLGEVLNLHHGRAPK